jgi:hypothetical protein
MTNYGRTSIRSTRRAWRGTATRRLCTPFIVLWRCPSCELSPRLQTWPALDLDMHALAFGIDPPTWRVLLELADPLDRIALRKYGGA